MNEITKDINITHLKRPALAVIKKPFLTNDEMTAELVRLLNHTAPASKPYIHVGGVFRAILALIDPITGDILATRYIGIDSQLYTKKTLRIRHDTPGTYYQDSSGEWVEKKDDTEQYAVYDDYMFPDIVFNRAIDCDKVLYKGASGNNIFNNPSWVTCSLDKKGNICSVQESSDKAAEDLEKINKTNKESKRIEDVNQLAININENNKIMYALGDGNGYVYRLYLFLDKDQQTMKSNNYTDYLLDLNDNNNTSAEEIFVHKPTQIKGSYTNGKVLLHKANSKSGPKMPNALRAYFSARSLANYDYAAYIWQFTLQPNHALLVLPRKIVNDILTTRYNTLQKYTQEIDSLTNQINSYISSINQLYNLAQYIYDNTDVKLASYDYALPGYAVSGYAVSGDTKAIYERTILKLKTIEPTDINSQYLQILAKLTEEEKTNLYSIYSNLYNTNSIDKVKSAQLNNAATANIDREALKVEIDKQINNSPFIKRVGEPTNLQNFLTTLIYKKLYTIPIQSAVTKEHLRDIQTQLLNLCDTWDNTHNNKIDVIDIKLVSLLKQLQQYIDYKTELISTDKRYDITPMLYNNEIALHYTPSRIITKLSTDTKNLKALDFKVKYYLLLYKKIKDKIEAKYQYFIDNNVAHIIPNENYEYIKDIWDNNKKIENKIQFCQVMENLLFNPWSGIYVCTDNKNYNLLYNITPTKSMIASTSSSIYSQQYDNAVDTLLSKRNEDISSLSISRVANGPSEANITIKNLNNIYVIPDTDETRNKYYQYIGTSIIEEMDEVMLYLPDYYMKDSNSNNLELCFRGLVGSVEYQNDKGYNSISVRAKCPIKYLEMSKTNIKPSFSYGENKQFNNGIPYHPWTIPPAFLQNMSAALSWMMTQSLSCIFCQPEPVKESDATKPVVSYKYVLNPNYNEEEKTTREKENKEYKITKYIKRITFSEPLFTYLWYVNNAINDRADQNQINNAYMSLLDEFVETESYDAITNTSIFKKGVHIVDKTDKTIDIHKSPNVYVYRYRQNVPYFSVEKSESNHWKLTNSGDSDPFIVGRLTGTTQPVYSLATSNIDARISDYKTNIDLIKEAVDKYNFAFYSDKAGIVTITPLNTSLLSLNTKRGTDSTVDYDKLFLLSTDLDTTEKYNPQVLTKEKVIKYTKSRDDSKVINFIQVNGQVPIAQSLNQNVGNLAIIKSQPLINKYGVRAQKTYPLLGANSASMCYAYGLALLDRQNKLIESANIEALADAAIELNNPVYCTVDNTIYYLDGIRLSYTPGRTATMSLSCTYGRKPLLRIADYIDKDLNDKLYGADYEYKGQKLKTITEDQEVEIGRRFTPIKSYTNVLDNTLNKVDAFYNDVDKILYKNMHTSTNTEGATRYDIEVYNVNNDKYKGYAYTLTEQSSLTSENTFYNNMYKILTDPKLCPKSVMSFCELMLTTVTKNDAPTTFYTKDDIIYDTKLVTALAEIYNKYKTRVTKSIKEESITRTEAIEREVMENYTETKRVIFIPDIVQQAYNSDVSKHLDTFDRSKLETDIRKLLEEDKIQPMTWVQLNNSLNNYLSTDKALYAAYADVAKSKCFLQLTMPHIAFNGYIYDYIPSILIEDLIFSHQALFRGANIGQMYLLLSEADKSITDSTQIINLNTIKVNSNNTITTNRVANNKLVNIISETGETSHISEAIQPIPAEILAKFCIPFTAAYGGDDRNATSLFNAVYKAEQIQKDISSLDRFFYDKNN